MRPSFGNLYIYLLSIPKTSVREIIKNSNGSFIIVGDSRLNAIGVQAQIKPIKIKTSSTWLEKLFIPLSLSGAALMMITFLASNKIVVLLCGLTCIAFFGYSQYVVYQSKNIDSQTKRSGFIIILPLLAVITAMVIKLRG